MPIITAYRHGVTAGIRNFSDHERARRGDCAGWTPRSTKGNLKFLRSVRMESLTGHGYAITLTVRDCPPTPGDWARLRRSFVKRLERVGMIRMHWVTEWQRRGVPHLHAAVWTPEPLNTAELYWHWLCVAGCYGAENRGQHLAPISDSLGWFQYVAKHAARGAGHYQRSPQNVPREWGSKTGRIWGKLGSWDLVEPTRHDLDHAGFYRLRRIVRAWRIADARASGSPRRIASARRMLACPDHTRSRVRGLSEWLRLEDLERVLGLLVQQGCALEKVEENG